MLTLTASERLWLAELYPNRASISDQLTVLDVAKKVLLSDEERAQIGYQADTQGRQVWMAAAADALTVDVTFTSAELDFLRERVRDMDAKKEITAKIVALCVKLRDAKG